MGLDLGTGSVGWAVTDTEYNLLKINRKFAWGSVLFDTSKGAEEKRLKRCNRRRYKREKERIVLLQQIFDEEICKVDSAFFHRLQESMYWAEDKRDENGNRMELPYSLFSDRAYTDVQYHQEYPTIYHLRSALIHEDRTFDVRLIYLAIAHILRHRGHFLNHVMADEVGDFMKTFREFAAIWYEMTEDSCFALLEEKQIISIQVIMQDRNKTKTKKKEEILEKIPDCKKETKEAVGLLIGSSIFLEKLFDNKNYKELEINKITFDNASYEENEEYYALNLGNDFDVIKKMRELYDWSKLAELMRGNPEGYFSDIKKEDYEKHKEDLRRLKNLLKTHSHELYKRTFGIPQNKEFNYSCYIGKGYGEEKKEKGSRETFYDFLEKKIFPNLPESAEKKYFLNEMRNGNFLPKQRTGENAIVPYQIHERELKQILKNAEAYLPFLLVKDETGFSNSEKILQLLTFRVPYYIGPLNEHSPRQWAIRKTHERVTPWNFEQIVDVEKSAETFITKATSYCTYLYGEKVLPESSLLYEKFKVLNELNNLTIRGEKLDVKLKQQIFYDLYEKKAVVNMKKFLNYIKCNTEYENISKEDIGGLAGEFKSALKSHHAFKKEFTDSMPSELEMEDIIKDMTIFGAEPKLLKQRLIKKYPLYEKQLLALMRNYKCGGWGRLSEKMLSGIAFENECGDSVRTIMYQLWHTQKNLSAILYDTEFPFISLIEKENKITNEQKENDKISYEMVEDLYVAPAIKRQIWKAMQVVEEVRHAKGADPKRIFVEMARGSQKKEIKVSRRKNLLTYLKGEKELLDELKEKTDDELRKDKLYLYFMQLGKCAYTGDRIDIDDLLYNNDLYDIDHIYPRSLTADDSLDNRVLVRKGENKDKDDVFPISPVVQKRMHETWRIWQRKGLISQEKYRRLTRVTELTQEELTQFVNRQLVETRQSTKAFMDIMKKMMPNTEFVYVKARNVVRFRRDFDVLKCRELNDFHHAQDAYLNIVVGNVYYMKFEKDIRKYFVKNGTKRTYNLTKMFNYNLVVKDENVWVVDNGTSISKVKNVLANNRVLISRQTFTKQGKLFDEQPKKEGNRLVPLKSGTGNERRADTKKYGGYDKATISYYTLITGKDKKGKPHTRFVSIPLYLAKRIEASEEYAAAFYKDETGLQDIEVRHNKILMQTLFVEEGFLMRLAGKSEKRVMFHNANELVVDYRYQKVIRTIMKYMSDKANSKTAKVCFSKDITENDFTELYMILLNKLEGTIYKENGEKLYTFMKNGREAFLTLAVEEKAQVLFEILKFFRCNAEMPNLKLIGGSGMGAIRISEDVTKRKTLAMIHQSVTGLYEVIERVNV